MTSIASAWMIHVGGGICKHVNMSSLKLLDVGGGVGVHKKQPRCKLGTELPVMDMPGWAPLDEVSISGHSVVVQLPAFMNLWVGGGLQQENPIAMCLHIVRI